ncbi:Two-component hybrid sensor and regulator [Methylophaga frappieri]|uniref:histidine kinase n=1 Tax=Methylophaga frappieri (strain ATCC BAA-2434 / DSM 25690 / JAM7) TaxID=754477 RepID=I1YJC1_METFJ|nr:ATP-binding protein [Methylophaga frappieri]AFJ03014.1 Two-component hybrid sensor and regulator [Methylophaga frappieri]
MSSNDALMDSSDQNAPQRIVKIRRDYNTWVANETLEDYALRFTPHAFRKWSIFRVSNTALGAISFLVLEVIGGTLAVNFGFLNAFWAILTISLIIFLTSLPISYYAAKYGLDMDLLTRGAGFGYIGSTISSFVYATFTFILFALEAVIMAYALSMYFELPIYVWYLISAIVIIPLVTHGVTLISRIQMITQPVWLFLMMLPFVFIFAKEPETVRGLMHFAGSSGYDAGFNIYMFGTAIAIGMALIPQVGEQVDFLRFMPEKNSQNRFRWHLGVILAGPGWIFIGMIKMFAGALLAYLAITATRSVEEAVNPTHMYHIAFAYVFDNADVLLAVTVFFVVLSQVKINITNAYAGSLAWSNFFARLTHSHPGRVVWLLFNVVIATMLMLFDVFQALEQILGLYSNIAISWITAVVADLVINKPLGLSPKGVEFRRAYLFDINPVGVGAMAIASVLSVLAFIGVFGLEVQSFSSFIAMFAALICSPLIAWWTKGKYYLAREPHQFRTGITRAVCSICEREFEIDDIAHCPAYQGPICSLCCCLDARCNDACKPHAKLDSQWYAWMTRLLPKSLWGYIQHGVGHYILLMGMTVLLLGAIFGLIYLHISLTTTANAAHILPEIRVGFFKAFAALVLVSGIIVWWLILTSQSRNVAQQESNHQTRLLQREIRLHEQTDAELQQARISAEQANEAKSRYITGISHELRTPLNSILGYAQLMDNKSSVPADQKNAIKVILRSGEHLLSLIEGTLDIARIESGKLQFDVKSLRFPEYIQQIVSMFELQAINKGLQFDYDISPGLPAVVRADHKRLSQILINIIGNAVKYTSEGGISLRFNHAREFLTIEIQDTGPGIKANELEHIFEPFARGSSAQGIGGTGLGLTISKLLTELMGGVLHVKSVVGEGTMFSIRLFLPSVRVEESLPLLATHMPMGYQGPRRKILVVDNEPIDRELLLNVLIPLGFEVKEAASGAECLQLYPEFQPEIIFMDLAMPEMDGWETCHLIRNVHKSSVTIGIISANAFDKNLENSSGITAKDFILKPVNLIELINWIGERLNIEWITPDSKAESEIQRSSSLLPPREIMEKLISLLNLGYLAGVRQLIDEIEADKLADAVFIAEIREMASRMQLSKLKTFIETKLANG